MNIKEIEIKNLRCLINKKIEFYKNTNIIYGENGSGKTSILEGIHILCYSKSFRPSKKNNIITKKQNSMLIKGVFTTDIKKQIKIKHTRVALEKKITLNNKKIKKTSELIGSIPCVVLSPEDIDVVSGPNNNKIKYIDKILSTCSAKYLKNLIEFKNTLKQRNRLLKTTHTKTELDVWCEKMATPAINIWKERLVFFKEYQNKVQEEYNNINIKGKVEIVYKTQTKPTKQSFIKKSNKNLTKDIKLKQTTLGPHKDVIEMFWDNKDMRNDASQGEKKLFLIALKKTEAMYFYKKTNKKPVVLLDDLFAKLDNKKCVDVISLFNNNFQTIITSTDNTVEPIIKKLNLKPIYLKKPELCFAA